MSCVEPVQAAYERILSAYLEGGDETALTAAYLLGRGALQHRAGMLQLIAAHHAALARLLTDRDDQEIAARAGTVLAETLAPFEMAQRGFQDANAQLQDLTQDLRAQVDARTRELSESLIELEDISTQRRRLLAHLVTAQEAERRRIAGEIHDDSIQIATALAMRLGVLAAKSEGEVREAAIRAENTAHQAIDRLRGLMFELRPPALEHEGLIPGLMELRHRFRQDWNFDWKLRDRLDAEPPLGTRIVLFRITQEALTNARKHSKAADVSVSLESQADGVAVRITDDGVGFDVSSRTTSTAGHLGMVSMRERAEMAGGWFRVDSRPDHGTTVEFWLPLLGEGPFEDRAEDDHPARPGVAR